MTKIANSYYSTAVSHREVDGLYHATFGIPGNAPEWVNGADGKPKIFRSQDEAVIAGFKILISKLNRARQEQDFHVRGDVHHRKETIKSWSAETRASEPTVNFSVREEAMSLSDQLEAARAHVAHLERIAATATCRELGCDMKSIGGCCASCDGEHGLCSCSVPVHTCTRCGDCDYGENEQAEQIRADCKLTRDPLFEHEPDEYDIATC